MELRYAFMSMECPCRCAGDRGLGQPLVGEGLLGVKCSLGGCRIRELWSWMFSLIDGPPCKRNRRDPDPETGTREPKAGPRPGGRDPGPRGRDPEPGNRDLEAESWNDLFMGYFSSTVCPLFSGFICTRARCERICSLFGDDETLPLRWGFARVGRKFDEEARNACIKGDASAYTQVLVLLLWLYSALVQDPGILRGRILARLRTRRMSRFSKTRRPKLRILMLDSTGLACSSRASVASCVVPGLYLDFWQRGRSAWDLPVYLFDSKSSSSGRLSLIARILESNGTVVLLQNPEMLFGPEGRFWSPEAALDPKIAFKNRRLSEDPEVDGEPGVRSYLGPRGHFRTRRSIGNPEVPLDPEVGFRTLRSFWDPEVDWEPRGRLGTRRFLQTMRSLLGRGVINNLEVYLFQGPYSAILGEATIGTCWDFAFYRSETGHYLVPVLHAAFCRKPLSDLGVLIMESETQVPGFFCFPRLEKQEFMYRSLHAYTGVIGSFDKHTQKATIRLRGAGYGFGNPSARLFLLSTSGEAGIYVSLPTRGSTYAICKLPELTRRVLPGNKSSIFQNHLLPIVCPLSFDFMGEAWTMLEPGGESFCQMEARGLDEYFQVLDLFEGDLVGFGTLILYFSGRQDLLSGPVTHVGRYVPWTYFLVDWPILDSITGNFRFLQLLEGGISGFVAGKTGSKVVGACFFVEPLDFTPCKVGSRRPGTWIRDLGSRTWDLGPGGDREPVFPALGRDPFAEQLRWNLMSTKRRSIHPAIIFPGAILMTPPIFEIRPSYASVASRACYPLILMLVETAPGAGSRQEPETVEEGFQVARALDLMRVSRFLPHGGWG
ncbi:hypothetical protein F2Q69_00012555 [Brassica cretica]|uniref:Uncharacterized protein n=1 Tax=Brassica cretica TaxID=69181 RepID=A0A8S9R9C2_BRACR|nr:hypothetical protein F2Q69_00012555 [Brassica cretica]